MKEPHLLARALLLHEGDTMISDEQLFELWRIEHDQAAFAEIEGRHSAAMLGSANRRLTGMGVQGAYHTAEDCVTETFLRLSIQQKSPACVRTWLFCVLRRLLIEEGRRRGRRPPIHSLHVATANEPSMAEPADPGLNPLEILLTAEQHDILLECLESLPDRYLEVVSMHYLEGMSYAEIIAQTGLTQATIGGRLDKARQYLAACYTRRLSGAE